jgi:hypothetical protein
MSNTKITDEYSDLPVSRQRKDQLRHPQRHQDYQRRWLESDVGKASKAAANKRYREKIKSPADKSIDIVPQA